MIIDAPAPRGSGSGARWEGHVSQPALEEQFEPTAGESVEAARARSSLTVALVATGIAALLGVALGMVAGYRGGKTDTFVSRLIDIVLSMPVLLLAIGLASVCSISANGCLGGALQPGLTLVVG